MFPFSLRTKENLRFLLPFPQMRKRMLAPTFILLLREEGLQDVHATGGVHAVLAHLEIGATSMELGEESGVAGACSGAHAEVDVVLLLGDHLLLGLGDVPSLQPLVVGFHAGLGLEEDNDGDLQPLPQHDLVLYGLVPALEVGHDLGEGEQLAREDCCKLVAEAV